MNTYENSPLSNCHVSSAETNSCRSYISRLLGDKNSCGTMDDDTGHGTVLTGWYSCLNSDVLSRKEHLSWLRYGHSNISSFIIQAYALYHGRLTHHHQSGTMDTNLTPTRENAIRHTITPWSIQTLRTQMSVSDASHLACSLQDSYWIYRFCFWWNHLSVSKKSET